MDYNVQKTLDRIIQDYVSVIPDITSSDLFDSLFKKYQGTYGYKFFQIVDNKLYLSTPQLYENETRLEAAKCHLLELLKKYNIPDTEFWYSDDDVLNTDDPIFVSTSCVHDRTQLLCPDFMFKFSPNSNMFNYVTDSTSILIEAQKQGIEFDIWKNRKNKVFFRGSSDGKRCAYMSLNDDMFDIKNVKTFVAPIGYPNYDPCNTLNACTREYKAQYKYLLQLNGNNDTAYSSAFRFNLACCSLVIYATKNPCKEWWMDYNIFKPGVHYVTVSDTSQLKSIYEYYENNQEEAFNISKNGYNFFKTWLNSYCVEYFYYNLLINYSKKIKYDVKIKETSKLVTDFKKL